jgi:hypothetical protein
MWCPYGYFLLSSSCFACPSLPNCLTCDPYSQCILCQQGYFLNNKICYACSSNCKDCSSLTFCNQAADGYFLQRHIDGSNSGVVRACQSPCLNCGYNANYCLTCINGYNISGISCISNAIFTVQIILGPGTSIDSIYTASDSDDIKLAKAIRGTNRIFNSICASLPASLKISDPYCLSIFRFLSFIQEINSIMITLQISGNGVTNVDENVNSLTNMFNSNGMDGLTINQIFVSSSGFNSYSLSSDSSSSRMLLIIAIAVVVVIGTH